MSETIRIELLLDHAQRLADAARPIALQHFRRPLAIELKSDLSPVTIVDRAIETELRRLIHEAFPAHGILGEEFGAEIGTDYTWVIDPIDGTKSFITGLPLFGTLIALLYRQQPILGVIDIPALGERWLGCRGRSTRFNHNTALTSTCDRLDTARIYTTTPEAFAHADWQRYETLSRKTTVRRYGGDCYAYGLLASGHCDLVVEAGLQTYDYMALVNVIEGAGGRISDWSGAALTLASDGRVIAAATEALWREALAYLA